MIKLENTEVLGWEAAIRGMRNPMNSWEKSDSIFFSPFATVGHDINGTTYDKDDGDFDYPEWFDWNRFNTNYGKEYFQIGPADHKLMTNLAKAGSVHAKYRRMIIVTVDVTAPEYWWPEMDAYKVGVVRNSCSKMHKLLSRPFSLDDFSFDRLPGYKRIVDQTPPEIDEEKEIWMNYIERYDVSNYGRIRHGSRILSGSLHKDGYIFVTIHGKQEPLHRIVAKCFIPNPDNKPEINHIDGNKRNNKIDNLEWVTIKENIKHSIENHLQPNPVKTYNGKFSKEEREEIKKRWDNGVSHTCINDIINDKYKYAENINLFELVARPTVDTLNELRDSYLECEDPESKKDIWYSILSLLPIGYNQRSTLMLNYEVLHNIYVSRKDHKLREWHDFCNWIKTLPYSEIITLEENNVAG